MNANENVWREMASTCDATTLRTQMEPYVGFLLRRAADGGEGRLTERLRAMAGDGLARRLATELCARLLEPAAPLVGRDTVLLAETLGG